MAPPKQPKAAPAVAPRRPLRSSVRETRASGSPTLTRGLGEDVSKDEVPATVPPKKRGRKGAKKAEESPEYSEEEEEVVPVPPKKKLRRGENQVVPVPPKKGPGKKGEKKVFAPAATHPEIC